MEQQRNIYVAGNYIAEQHIDTQILNIHSQPQNNTTYNVQGDYIAGDKHVGTHIDNVTPMPSAHKQPKYKTLRRKNVSFTSNMRRLSVIINQNTNRKIKNIMEDNAKTIINVAGDYVQSKHVDYEINNVEAGGIGIQFVNGKQTTIKPSAAKSSLRIKTPKLQTATFKYRYWDKSTTPITHLYQCLLNAKWIAPDTKPDDFLAIFSGEESTARVKWLGKPAYLYYLIRRGVESQLISLPEGGKIWQITESHFTDSNSRPLHDLRKQKEPKTAIPAIEVMLKILEPSA